MIERWWIIDGVTFGFETNIYIKKHVSNKPTTWNDIFSCPFLSLSQGTITYHIPILKVAGSPWFSCWSQGRGIGFQWPCCFAENQGVVFSPTKQWPNQKTDQTGLWCQVFWTKTDPTSSLDIYTHRIPMGLPYLLIHLPNTFKPIHYPVLYFIISGLFSTFLPSSGTASCATMSVRCTASRCESGTKRQPQSSLTLWHRWANDVSWPNWRPFLAVLFLEMWWM